MDWSTFVAVVLGGLIAALSPLPVERIRANRETRETKRASFASVVEASADWIALAAETYNSLGDADVKRQADRGMAAGAAAFAQARLVCDEQETDVAILLLQNACGEFGSMLRQGASVSNENVLTTREAFIRQARKEMHRSRFEGDTIALAKARMGGPDHS